MCKTNKLPASFPGVMMPVEGLGAFTVLFGLVFNSLKGGAGSLYHLKSGWAFRKASLY